MPIRIAIGTALILAALGSVALAGEPAAPRNFLYTSAGDLAADTEILKRPDIAGVQVVYNWKALEPAEGKYDFSSIEADLQLADTLKKQLVIQVQDRFFSPKARNIPDYLLAEPQYGGGLVPQFDNPGENKPVGSGWATMQWNPAVRARYQALLAALAARFDGKVLGINLPETSIDLDTKNDKSGFSCDAYFAAEMENLTFARAAFAKSHVVQYVNFWPCEWDNDHNYMGRLFDYASQNDIGLGGPDIVPGRKAQMHNSYPFFNQYKGRLGLVAMAVQEPTLTYKNPKTHKPFTKDEFTAFARDYLGASIIFWSKASPWLKH
ncbi:MAG TPA: hypothetical protein VGM83_01305 [Devosiaceae bacterium]